MTKKIDAVAVESHVKTLLDELKLKADVTEKGDLKILMELKKDRAQTVVINSKAGMIGSTAMVEINSPAVKLNGLPSRKFALHLLKNNEKQKLGSWQLLPLEKEGSIVFYSITIPSSIDAETFHSVLKIVASTADAMEEKTKGGDMF